MISASRPTCDLNSPTSHPPSNLNRSIIPPKLPHCCACASPDEIFGRHRGHDLEQQLIHALVECLTESTSNFLVEGDRVMTSFEDLLLTEPNRPWRVAEVSRRLGMSDRLVRESCQACVGMSPQHFIRLQRLHAVHRALRHPASSSTSVSEVGHQHGFRHLSRLAVDYRTLFGELPSHTLRRGRYGAVPPLKLSRRFTAPRSN